MASCDCAFADIALECVLASIQEWTPYFSKFCGQGFLDIPFDSDHGCVELSKEMFVIRMVHLQLHLFANKYTGHLLNLTLIATKCWIIFSLNIRRW